MDKRKTFGDIRKIIYIYSYETNRFHNLHEGNFGTLYVSVKNLSCKKEIYLPTTVTCDHLSFLARK